MSIKRTKVLHCSCLFPTTHHLVLDGLETLRSGQSRSEGCVLQIVDGRGRSMTPNTPRLFQTGPSHLLEYHVFRAVLLLGRRVGIGGDGRPLTLVLRLHLDFSGGLTAGNAHDDLTNSGVGQFGDLRRAVGDDPQAGEESAGSAVVLFQGPGDLFIPGTVVDARAEAVGEAGAADFAEFHGVASVAVSTVSFPCTSH